MLRPVKAARSLKPRESRTSSRTWAAGPCAARLVGHLVGRLVDITDVLRFDADSVAALRAEAKLGAQRYAAEFNPSKVKLLQRENPRTDGRTSCPHLRPHPCPHLNTTPSSRCP